MLDQGTCSITLYEASLFSFNDYMLANSNKITGYLEDYHINDMTNFSLWTLAVMKDRGQLKCWVYRLKFHG